MTPGGQRVDCDVCQRTAVMITSHVVEGTGVKANKHTIPVGPSQRASFHTTENAMLEGPMDTGVYATHSGYDGHVDLGYAIPDSLRHGVAFRDSLDGRSVVGFPIHVEPSESTSGEAFDCNSLSDCIGGCPVGNGFHETPPTDPGGGSHVSFPIQVEPSESTRGKAVGCSSLTDCASVNNTESNELSETVLTGGSKLTAKAGGSVSRGCTPTETSVELPGPSTSCIDSSAVWLSHSLCQPFEGRSPKGNLISKGPVCPQLVRQSRHAPAGLLRESPTMPAWGQHQILEKGGSLAKETRQVHSGQIAMSAQAVVGPRKAMISRSSQVIEGRSSLLMSCSEPLNELLIGEQSVFQEEGLKLHKDANSVSNSSPCHQEQKVAVEVIPTPLGFSPQPNLCDDVCPDPYAAILTPLGFSPPPDSGEDVQLDLSGLVQNPVGFKPSPVQVKAASCGVVQRPEFSIPRAPQGDFPKLSASGVRASFPPILATAQATLPANLLRPRSFLPGWVQRARESESEEAAPKYDSSGLNKLLPTHPALAACTDYESGDGGSPNHRQQQGRTHTPGAGANAQGIKGSPCGSAAVDPNHKLVGFSPEQPPVQGSPSGDVDPDPNHKPLEFSPNSPQVQGFMCGVTNLDESHNLFGFSPVQECGLQRSPVQHPRCESLGFSSVSSCEGNTRQVPGAAGIQVIAKHEVQGVASNQVATQVIANPQVPSVAGNQVPSQVIANPQVPSVASNQVPSQVIANSQVPSVDSNQVASQVVVNPQVPGAASNHVAASVVAKPQVQGIQPGEAHPGQAASLVQGMQICQVSQGQPACQGQGDHDTNADCISPLGWNPFLFRVSTTQVRHEPDLANGPIRFQIFSDDEASDASDASNIDPCWDRPWHIMSCSTASTPQGSTRQAIVGEHEEAETQVPWQINVPKITLVRWPWNSLPIGFRPSLRIGFSRLLRLSPPKLFQTWTRRLVGAGLLTLCDVSAPHCSDTHVLLDLKMPSVTSLTSSGCRAGNVSERLQPRWGESLHPDKQSQKWVLTPSEIAELVRCIGFKKNEPELHLHQVKDAQPSSVHSPQVKGAKPGSVHSPQVKGAPPGIKPSPQVSCAQSGNACLHQVSCVQPKVRAGNVHTDQVSGEWSGTSAGDMCSPNADGRKFGDQGQGHTLQEPVTPNSRGCNSPNDPGEVSLRSLRFSPYLTRIDKDPTPEVSPVRSGNIRPLECSSQQDLREVVPNLVVYRPWSDSEEKVSAEAYRMQPSAKAYKVQPNQAGEVHVGQPAGVQSSAQAYKVHPGQAGEVNVGQPAGVQSSAQAYKVHPGQAGEVPVGQPADMQPGAQAYKMHTGQAGKAQPGQPAGMQPRAQVHKVHIGQAGKGNTDKSPSTSLGAIDPVEDQGAEQEAPVESGVSAWEAKAWQDCEKSPGAQRNKGCGSMTTPSGHTSYIQRAEGLQRQAYPDRRRASVSSRPNGMQGTLACGVPDHQLPRDSSLVAGPSGSTEPHRQGGNLNRVLGHLEICQRMGSLLGGEDFSLLSMGTASIATMYRVTGVIKEYASTWSESKQCLQMTHGLENPSEVAQELNLERCQQPQSGQTASVWLGPEMMADKGSGIPVSIVPRDHPLWPAIANAAVCTLDTIGSILPKLMEAGLATYIWNKFRQGNFRSQHATFHEQAEVKVGNHVLSRSFASTIVAFKV